MNNLRQTDLPENSTVDSKGASSNQKLHIFFKIIVCTRYVMAYMIASDEEVKQILSDLLTSSQSETT